jgi:hypothetical protein
MADFSVSTAGIQLAVRITGGNAGTAHSTRKKLAAGQWLHTGTCTR